MLPAPVYDEEWYDIYTKRNKYWFDREWYNRDGFNKYWVNKEWESYEYVILNRLHKSFLWILSYKTERDRERIDKIDIIFSEAWEGYICPICNSAVDDTNWHCKCNNTKELQF